MPLIGSSLEEASVLILPIDDAEKDHKQAAKDELLDKWMEETTGHRRPQNRSMIANI